MGRKLIDLIGQRFGRLTVIERAENDKHGNTRWLCQCECGNTTIVHASNLRKCSHTNSCGCLQKEVACKLGKSICVHGMEGTRIYSVWQTMKQRCLNSNCAAYPNYGGRGITICEEWLSFENFLKDAMALGYADNLSIDRIDVNKGYSPDNVRFVSMKAQQNNKRNNRCISFGGKTRTITQWAEEINLNPETLRRRITYGWSIEEALTTPVGGKRKKK